LADQSARRQPVAMAMKRLPALASIGI